jgi:hypothetical protein
MHLLRNTTLVMAALTAVPPMAFANERITVQLRGGERVAGRLDGLTNGMLHLNDVSGMEERRIPLGNVALIDLVGGAQGLPETELVIARQSGHLLLLRDGSSVRGQLQEITGSEREDERPARVVFRTSTGEERRIPLRRVARLYLGNYQGESSTTNTEAGTLPPTRAPGTVHVAADQRWVDTGIVVLKDQPVRFETTGEVRLSTDEGDVAVSAGSKRGRRAAGAPLPDALAGALIGRVGNGTPFGIGNQGGPLPMPASGRLYLSVNDDELSDNSGAFTVRVTPEPTSTTFRGRRRPS